jgi:hypothetical protein
VIPVPTMARKMKLSFSITPLVVMKGVMEDKLMELEMETRAGVRVYSDIVDMGRDREERGGLYEGLYTFDHGE